MRHYEIFLRHEGIQHLNIYLMRRNAALYRNAEVSPEAHRFFSSRHKSPIEETPMNETDLARAVAADLGDDVYAAVEEHPSPEARHPQQPGNISRLMAISGMRGSPPSMGSAFSGFVARSSLFSAALADFGRTYPMAARRSWKISRSKL